MTSALSRFALAASAGAMVMTAVATPAAAQSRYGEGYYENGAPIDRSQNYGTPPRFDVPEPDGYDGTRPPPPPPGYEKSEDYGRWSEQDSRYAAEAERWARDNCVKSRPKTGEGALIGGVLGAIIGSALSSGVGHHHHGSSAGGTVAGLAVGAVAGAAIGSSSGGETSPGCPPGYAVRRNATVYVYQTDYVYAAPGWYRPWVYSGGYWAYRPYPYHRWYREHYRAYPHYHGGYYRAYPGYRGGYHYDRHHGGDGHRDYRR